MRKNSSSTSELRCLEERTRYGSPHIFASFGETFVYDTVLSGKETICHEGLVE